MGLIRLVLMLCFCAPFVVGNLQMPPASSMVNMSNPFQVKPLTSSHISNLGEGPHWSGSRLFYVDAFAGLVRCFDTQTHTDSSVNLGDLVTIVIPFENNPDLLLVSLRNKIVKLNWTSQRYEVIAEVAADRNGKERFNDGKIDAAGRLWIGTVLEGSTGVVKGGGSLYKLDQNRFISMSANFTLSNGMAWNRNNTLMYFNDSEERLTYVFDFDLVNGTLSNKRVFLNYSKASDIFGAGEYPDGMAIDANDFLWVSLYGGGRIVRIDPQTTQVTTSIRVAAPYTTSLAFGGNNHTEIYVTSGEVDKKDEEARQLYPNAGRLFHITTDVQGTQAFHYTSKI